MVHQAVRVCRLQRVGQLGEEPEATRDRHWAGLDHLGQGRGSAEVGDDVVPIGLATAPAGDIPELAPVQERADVGMPDCGARLRRALETPRRADGSAGLKDLQGHGPSIRGARLVGHVAPSVPGERGADAVAKPLFERRGRLPRQPSL
jgi:hypothetical protein